MALIALKLCFAGPSCSDTAAETGELMALTDKTGQGLFELGEFNLEFALVADRALSEDI